jgi:hypothetical protein
MVNVDVASTHGDNKGGSLVWQAISDTIDRAVNLRIVTLVGEASITGPCDDMKIDTPKAPVGSLVTDINLVGGDITNMVSEKLLGVEYATVRTSHQESVKQAQEILARNVNILVSIVKEIGEHLGALPPPNQGPSRGP